VAAQLSLDVHGIMAGIPFVPSPNFDERPEPCAIRLLVIHNISLPPDEFGGPGIIDFFLNRLDPSAHPYYQTICGLHVSAHFLIRRDAELLQFVPCSRRAWHAGQSRWRGLDNCNDFSIGLELEGCDTRPFEPNQYESLAALTSALRRHYPIEDVVGHSDVAPGRKTDPGPCFDWKLYRQLIGCAHEKT
jgi:N-acetyl-anhydromuramoyl-L-alanine amidase